jgi:hypothetical protein
VWDGYGWNHLVDENIHWVRETSHDGGSMFTIQKTNNSQAGYSRNERTV